MDLDKAIEQARANQLRAVDEKQVFERRVAECEALVAQGTEAVATALADFYDRASSATWTGTEAREYDEVVRPATSRRRDPKLRRRVVSGWTLLSGRDNAMLLPDRRILAGFFLGSASGLLSTRDFASEYVRVQTLYQDGDPAYTCSLVVEGNLAGTNANVTGGVERVVVGLAQLLVAHDLV